MKYYFQTNLPGINFDQAIQLVTEKLKEEGFGILTEVDIQSTLKNKLDVNFKPYRILGACHPPSAYKALKAEDKIGLFLPCNVIVEENDDGMVEVAVVDPIASMLAVENADLAAVAKEVQSKLKTVSEKLTAAVLHG